MIFQPSGGGNSIETVPCHFEIEIGTVYFCDGNGVARSISESKETVPVIKGSVLLAIVPGAKVFDFYNKDHTDSTDLYRNRQDKVYAIVAEKECYVTALRG